MLQAVWPTLAWVKPLQASPPQWDKSRVTLMQEHRVQSISGSRRGSPARPTSARVERVFVRKTPIGTAPEPFSESWPVSASLQGLAVPAKPLLA